MQTSGVAAERSNNPTTPRTNRSMTQRDDEFWNFAPILFENAEKMRFKSTAREKT